MTLACCTQTLSSGLSDQQLQEQGITDLVSLGGPAVWSNEDRTIYAL